MSRQIAELDPGLQGHATALPDAAFLHVGALRCQASLKEEAAKKAAAFAAAVPALIAANPAFALVSIASFEAVTGV